MASKDERPEASSFQGRAGIGVDTYGGSTVDPTKNVLDLVEAANQRQDDLRKADVLRIEGELHAFKDFLKELMAAHDKRYEQRYEAQQKALDAAFTAQKDAVSTAMVAQKEASNNALAAQDRAVAKAENAAEKRFEGADKARLEQAEQQRTLMPRSEAENRMAMLSEKIGVLEGFRTEQLSRGNGAKEGYGWAVGLVGLVLSILAIIATAITLFRIGT
jgi:hypothetical protein